MQFTETEKLLIATPESPEDTRRLRASGFFFMRGGGKWSTPFPPVAKTAGFSKAGSSIARRCQKLRAMSLAADFEGEFFAPSGLSYLPFQKAAIAYGLEVERALISDPMGLGKTIESIGVMNASEKLGRVLVICPASLKINWSRELLKWLIHRKTIQIIEPKTKELTGEILVVNYDIVDRFYPELRSEKFHFLILDECHYLKNAKAKRSLNVVGGRSKTGKRFDPIPAERVLALTGTPILNRPKEIFNIARYLMPEAFPNKEKFLRRYCDLRLVRGRWDDTGASNLDELQAKLRSVFMIRREKEMVLKDLPAKRRQLIEIEPEGRLRDKIIKEYEAASVKKFNIPFDDVSALRRETGLAKVKIAVEFLKNAIEESGKVVAFCHHRDVIEKIAEKIPCVVVRGDTPLKRRAENVDLFQRSPECKLFLGNIEAAGIGITLTAASRMVFVEGSWEPGKVSQCEDRIHRIGQKNSVLIQHLVWAGSLDSYMTKRVIEKQEVISEALDDNEMEFLK